MFDALGPLGLTAEALGAREVDAVDEEERPVRLRADCSILIPQQLAHIAHHLTRHRDSQYRWKSLAATYYNQP